MYFNVYENRGLAETPRFGEFSLVNTGLSMNGCKSEYELFFHTEAYTWSIGFVKFGFRGQSVERADTALPGRFKQLPEGYFSLGQSEGYYSLLKDLGDELREEVLEALRDVAYDLTAFEQFREETVMKTYLMCSITEFSVRNQFHRIAHGGEKLSKYSFTYTIPCDPDHPELGENCLDFDVEPYTSPPSNVHVLIGRNGTGKTSILKDMILSIRGERGSRGRFEYVSDVLQGATFANVICVAFSPFDDFSSLEQKETFMPYTYVGLDKTSGNLFKSLEEQFCDAFSRCMISRRKKELWLDAIDILQRGDETFRETNIEQLAEEDGFLIPKPREIARHFSPLSSGHKVVLLTVTSCVDRIEERSILFLDEPENHLHPPLLAALIRALSDLLVKRNGVAIIATHSPVVLQEVHDKCVWKLRRCGSHLLASRPTIQTFGETIGALTKDVFGLELRRSGFYHMIVEDVKTFGDYDEIYERYQGRLGTEAELLLRTMLSARRRGETI